MKSKLLFLLIFLTLSCADRDRYKENISFEDIELPKSEDFINIDVLKLNKALEVSTISDNIDFVPLETTKSSYFQFIDDVFVNDSLIIINARGFVLFWDNKGKFLRRFEKLGRGPEEYEVIFGFSVDFESNQMAIADQQFIKLYDLEGDFIKNLKIPGHPFSLTANLAFLDSKNILVESSRFKSSFEEGYSPLWKVNLESDEFTPLFKSYPSEVEEFYHKYNFSGKLSDSKNNVLYAASESYKTYRIDKEKGEFNLVYDMDFGKYGMPEGLIHNSDEYLDFRKLFVQLAYINESEDYFFVRYGMNKGFNGRSFEMGYFVYDKVNREVLANQMESDGMISSKYPALKLWPRFIDSNDRLICMIENKEALTSGIEGVKKGDNPVLAIIKLL